MDLIEASVYHERTLQRLNRSPQTVRLYQLYEKSFLTFLLEHDVNPTRDALNPQFVREWQAWLRGKSTGRRGGIVTEKQGVMTLKTWGRFLFENDVYEYDPLARLKIPRVQKIQRKPFTQDEAVRLVAAAAAGSNPIRDRALLLMLFDTGCRVGELCAATVQDVDLVEGSITFNHTKNGRPRTVRFRVQDRRDGGPCLQALKNWLRIRDARIGVTALFTTREHRPMSTRRVRELFEEFGKAARVPGAIPHRCRHTSATEFLAERPGAEIQLRSRLGQVSHGVLADYVSQSDPSIQSAADTASLSTKWNLGSGRNQRSQDRALPAPRGKASVADVQAILDRVAGDPALLAQLLAQLLNQRGAA